MVLCIVYSPSQPIRADHNPSGADQAVFAHTMMSPAPSWEEGVQSIVLDSTWWWLHLVFLSQHSNQGFIANNVGQF